MKKLILMAMVLCGATVFAEDSYIYWMVDPVEAGSFADKYTSASLSAYKGETLVGDIAYSDGGPVWSVFDNAKYGPNAGAYTFFIELWNDDGNFVAHQALGDYDNIKSSIKSSVGAMTSPLGSGAGGGGYAIPEPTSGMMMLVGLALLGLRRKKA